jgi:putative membrane protein
MIRKPIFAIGFAAAFALAASAAQAQGNPPMQMQEHQEHKASKSDQTFIPEAIQIDMAEVQMGKLAQDKGNSDEAKNFGQVLAADHNTNEVLAKQLAQQLGVPAPAQPSQEQQAEHEKLSKLSGADFDREFAQMMVQGHRQAIRLFEKQEKLGDATSDYVKLSLPMLRWHLRLAEDLSERTATTGSR